MDVTSAEQARVAEAAGACAVMALERVPADIRKDGGVARMSAPEMIKSIKEVICPGKTAVPQGHLQAAPGNGGSPAPLLAPGGDHPGDGQGSHWALCRGPDTGGARD